ncbi:MAG: uroporphyrinogen-III synthase [Gammaproteobacteria bacterium]|nr:uroporphyrinogen-III synthase [Gammaproteobacteria bacterium]
MTENELAGVGVLVTRPAHQASDLVEAIRACGGGVVAFPVLHIVPRDSRSIDAEVDKLHDPDIVIFVSPNAVRHGLAYAGTGQLAVIGPATARAIEAAGRSVDISPSAGFDSEHLLARAELQEVSGRCVRIIRGDAGRELLADTLRDRGATVEYLPVYSREPPDYSPSELDDLERKWRAGKVNVVTVMSVESLLNLVAVLPEWCAARLRDTPLVTPATRVIKEALERFPGIPTTLARGPQASDMVNAIIACTKNPPG